MNVPALKQTSATLTLIVATLKDRIPVAVLLDIRATAKIVKVFHYFLCHHTLWTRKTLQRELVNFDILYNDDNKPIEKMLAPCNTKKTSTSYKITTWSHQLENLRLPLILLNTDIDECKAV